MYYLNKLSLFHLLIHLYYKILLYQLFQNFYNNQLFFVLTDNILKDIPFLCLLETVLLVVFVFLQFPLMNHKSPDLRHRQTQYLSIYCFLQ